MEQDRDSEYRNDILRELELQESKTKTRFFSFGQNHAHEINERIVDRNTIIKITAENPRDVMFDFFGDKWSFEYTEETFTPRFWKEIYEPLTDKAETI